MDAPYFVAHFELSEQAFISWLHVLIVKRGSVFAEISLTWDIANVAQDCWSKGEAPTSTGIAIGHCQQKQHNGGTFKGKIESKAVCPKTG